MCNELVCTPPRSDCSFRVFFFTSAGVQSWRVSLVIPLVRAVLFACGTFFLVFFFMGCVVIALRSVYRGYRVESMVSCRSGCQEDHMRDNLMVAVCFCRENIIIRIPIRSTSYVRKPPMSLIRHYFYHHRYSTTAPGVIAVLSGLCPQISRLLILETGFRTDLTVYSDAEKLLNISNILNITRTSPNSNRALFDVINNSMLCIDGRKVSWKIRILENSTIYFKSRLDRNIKHN
jgi:hypothetical protein